MPTVNGEYFLPPVYEATPGERIRADQHNIPLRDIAQGLTDRVMRDGTSPMTGSLPMNGHKISGLAAGTANSDAARMDQVRGASWQMTPLTTTDDLNATITPGVYAWDAPTAPQNVPVAASAATLIVTQGVNSTAVQQEWIERDGTRRMWRVRDGASDWLPWAEAVTFNTLPDGVPLGSVIYFTKDTVADGYILADGTAVTALYPEYRQLLLDAGAPFGMAGSDPLRPQLLGEFIRGWDAGRGVDAGRVFGSRQEDELRSHDHLVSDNVPSGGTGSPLRIAANTGPNPGIAPRTGFTGGDETRPRNVALLPMIKAFGAVTNIPGVADMNGWLAQAKADAQAIVPPEVARSLEFKQVARVPVGTGSEVIITGLDLSKETSLAFVFLRNNGTAARTFRVTGSEDGGVTWLDDPVLISANINWSANILRGGLGVFTAEGGDALTEVATSSAGGGDGYFLVKAPLTRGATDIITPDCNTIKFDWSAGNFAPSGASYPDADHILVYQRG